MAPGEVVYGEETTMLLPAKWWLLWYDNLTVGLGLEVTQPWLSHRIRKGK